MTPPCAGYFDRNGDWNLICNLATAPQAQRPLHVPGDAPAPPFAPLKYDPVQSSALNIEWQPKTSQNVEGSVVNAGGQTPDNLPAGGELSIKYESKSKFGAVLMTLRPITLTAYNDERLFVDWLDNNRPLLFNTYGTELRKYGLWIVTRTYSAPGCSINAWQDNSKQNTISMKAKASMLGELADGEVSWKDKMTDKDWSHYKAKQGDGLVVFMDGIEVPKSNWWIEGVRQAFNRNPNRSHSNSPDRMVQYDPSTVIPAHVGESLTVPKQRSPGSRLPVSTNGQGYLSPLGRPNNKYEYFSSDDPNAHADVGVMPTWSENTVGPNTHGGTQNYVPTGNGGYVVNSPIQKTKENRTDSGFASQFTKMVTPQPWEGMDSPVVGRQQAQTTSASAPPQAPAQAPAPATPASKPAPDTPATNQGSETPGTQPGPATPAPVKHAEDAHAWKLDNGWIIDLQSPVDDETLETAGIKQFNRRSVSIRRPSNASSMQRPASIAPSIAESSRSTNSLGRTKSLRRETRSISGESIKDEKGIAERIGTAHSTYEHRRQSSAA